MFCKSDNLSLLAQVAYKRYFDKKEGFTTQFEEGDMVFLDQPKHKAKTAKERDKPIAKSNLLPKSTGPLLGIRDYPDVIVVYQADSELPVSVDLCSNTPAKNKTPDDPKIESDMTNPAFPLPHPIINENYEFFSDGFAYHPSETAATQSPFHISLHELDSKKNFAPNSIPIDKQTPQLSANLPNSSPRSSNDLSKPSLPPPPPIVSNQTLLRTIQVYPSPLLVFRVISHDSTTIPIKYTCQLTMSLVSTLPTTIYPPTSFLLIGRQSQRSPTRTHTCVSEGVNANKRGVLTSEQQTRIRNLQINSDTKQQLLLFEMTYATTTNKSNRTNSKRYRQTHIGCCRTIALPNNRIENVKQRWHTPTHPFSKTSQTIIIDASVYTNLHQFVPIIITRRDCLHLTHTHFTLVVNSVAIASRTGSNLFRSPSRSR